MGSKYLQPGESISHGTLLTEDLISNFISAFRTLSLTKKQLRLLKDIEEEAEKRAEDEEYLGYLLEELFDLGQDLVPDGYYFGANCGDGSDFGCWSSEDLP